MSIRIPHRWEDAPDPLDGVTSEAWTPPVCLPQLPDLPPQAATVGGELRVGGLDPRDARDSLVRTTMRNGASREWAEATVSRAVRRWDAGIRNGSIKRPE